MSKKHHFDTTPVIHEVTFPFRFYFMKFSHFRNILIGSAVSDLIKLFIN